MSIAEVALPLISRRGTRAPLTRAAADPFEVEIAGRHLRTTEVLDTYWKFAARRQGIYLQRLKGNAGPWTDDPILSAHRFTNCYRAADRVSQYLIREVIYNGDQDF